MQEFLAGSGCNSIEGPAEVAGPHNSVALRKLGPIRWLIGWGIALIVVIMAGTAIMVINFRENTIAEKTRELENAVQLLAGHFDQELDDFSVVENMLAQKVKHVVEPDDFRRLTSTYDTHLWLKTKLEGATDLTGVNVYDANGRLINSSDSFPVPAVDISDRKYFLGLKSSSSTSLEVELLRSRVTGHSVVLIARKMTGANGALLGVATRGFSPTRFEKFFSSFADGKDAAISVHHRDGTLLARHPHVEGAIGKNFRDGQSFPAQLLRLDRGSAQLASRIDGRPRLVAIRALNRFPLTIVGTTTIAAALSDWRTQTNSIIFAAGLLVAVVALTLFLIFASLLRQHRESQEQLSHERKRLYTAINNMPQSLLLYDSDGRLIVSNDRYLNMFGLSRDVVQPGGGR